MIPRILKVQKITKFADKLVDDLDPLPWPEYIKDAQRNWIGRTKGAEIDFKVPGNNDEHSIKVFTTRPETIFGATFLAVSAGLAKKWLGMGWSASDDIKNYIAETLKEQSVRDFKEKEKTGIAAGFNAINPATKEEIPVWITNYVLDGVGTGAIMAVPAHDERDFDFAQKFYLDVKYVVRPEHTSATLHFYGPYLKEGELINSEQFSGMNSEEAKEKITEFVGGKMTTTYRLRDWGISRQRYWGVPIPIVYDPEGKAHAIPIEHLPWLLPTDVDHTPDGTSPLARSKELFERTEKIFGKGWKPEIETMDTFVDSSWYFYRYLDNKNHTEFASNERMKKWMPIDMYFGGAEHTTMHLLYSRFWTKALHELGIVDDAEPYVMRRNRGLILGPDGNKMSKSKGNVIDPDEVVKWVGADATRMYLAFMGPYGVTDNYPWDPNGVVGIRRFLERVLNYYFLWKETKNKDLTDGDTIGYYSGKVSNKTDLLINKAIKKITEDIEALKFNTAISSMMIFLNDVYKEKRESSSIGTEILSSESYQLTNLQMSSFLRLLAPFAPHITEEIWHDLGETSSIHLSEWPKYDESKINEEKVKIAVQVNGKVRGEIEIARDANEDEVKDVALSTESVKAFMGQSEIKKFIYVPGKIVNIVI
jgi:leucyl-tRNA synthetase